MLKIIHPNENILVIKIVGEIMIAEANIERIKVRVSLILHLASYILHLTYIFFITGWKQNNF